MPVWKADHATGCSPRNARLQTISATDRRPFSRPDRDAVSAYRTGSDLWGILEANCSRFMTLGSHQTTVGKSQVWLTPKWIIEALGPFDLDPCAADPRPWDCAEKNFTEADDGALRPWHGTVWLNPPFDRYQVQKWVAKLAEHGSGIVLLHARTEAKWFRPLWESAGAILFLTKRIKFCDEAGVEAAANSGAPPVLAAFGTACTRRLIQAAIPGALVDRWTLK